MLYFFSSMVEKVILLPFAALSACSWMFGGTVPFVGWRDDSFFFTSALKPNNVLIFQFKVHLKSFHSRVVIFHVPFKRHTISKYQLRIICNIRVFYELLISSMFHVIHYDVSYLLLLYNVCVFYELIHYVHRYLNVPYSTLDPLCVFYVMSYVSYLLISWVQYLWKKQRKMY